MKTAYNTTEQKNKMTSSIDETMTTMDKIQDFEVFMVEIKKRVENRIYDVDYDANKVALIKDVVREMGDFIQVLNAAPEFRSLVKQSLYQDVVDFIQHIRNIGLLVFDEELAKISNDVEDNIFEIICVV